MPDTPIGTALVLLGGLYSFRSNAQNVLSLLMDCAGLEGTASQADTVADAHNRLYLVEHVTEYCI